MPTPNEQPQPKSAKPHRALRTLRDPQQREHQHKVRMNDAEYELIAANAAASGLGIVNYLRTRGMEPLSADGGSLMSRPMRAAWVAELYAVKRILRGSSTNLNQLARAANATGDAQPEAQHHAERIARMEQRLDALLDAIEPELKPRS